jgi:hypothetical protein
MSVLHHHAVHGLHVASDLPLPELRPSALSRDAAPDVRVRCVAVPELPEDPPDRWFHVREDGTAVLRIAGIATYAARDGCSIDVEVADAADLAEVRVYLLGSALGVLLHQRGELPLHVSAVVIDGRAWAFTAPSGTGKSTLAAALHLHARLPLVTDDVGVARPALDGTGGLWLWPGPQSLKLRPDAYADVAAVAPPTLPEYARSAKVRLGTPAGAMDAPVPLAGIVLLQRSPDDDDADVLRVERVVGAPAFLTVQAAVYRLSHGAAVASTASVFDRIAWLARSVPCFIGTMGSSTRPASSERALAVARVLRELDADRAAVVAPA